MFNAVPSLLALVLALQQQGISFGFVHHHVLVLDEVACEHIPTVRLTAHLLRFSLVVAAGVPLFVQLRVVVVPLQDVPYESDRNMKLVYF